MTGKPGTSTFLLTWVALLALTLLTSLLGLVNLGVMTMVLAVVIAAMKATLIGLIFMHALYDTKLVRVSAVTAIIWVCFLLVLTAADYFSRGWLLPTGK